MAGMTLAQAVKAVFDQFRAAGGGTLPQVRRAVQELFPDATSTQVRDAIARETRIRGYQAQVAAGVPTDPARIASAPSKRAAAAGGKTPLISPKAEAALARARQAQKARGQAEAQRAGATTKPPRKLRNVRVAPGRQIVPTPRGTRALPAPRALRQLPRAQDMMMARQQVAAGAGQAAGAGAAGGRYTVSRATSAGGAGAAGGVGRRPPAPYGGAGRSPRALPAPGAPKGAGAPGSQKGFLGDLTWAKLKGPLTLMGLWFLLNDATKKMITDPAQAEAMGLQAQAQREAMPEAQDLVGEALLGDLQAQRAAQLGTGGGSAMMAAMAEQQKLQQRALQIQKLQQGMTPNEAMVGGGGGIVPAPAPWSPPDPSRLHHF